MFCVPFVTNVRSFKLLMHGENIMLTWPHINQKSKWVVTGQTEEWTRDTWKRTRRRWRGNQVLHNVYNSRNSKSHYSLFPFDPALRIFSFFQLRLSSIPKVQLARHSDSALPPDLLMISHFVFYKTKKQTSGLQSARELHRPSDRRLSEKSVPTLTDRGCLVVSATNSHGR
jgi:hypothetical protein